jgi:hypothetical protein
MNSVLASIKEDLERAEELVARQIAFIDASTGSGADKEPAKRELDRLQTLATAAQRRYDMAMAFMPPESK